MVKSQVKKRRILEKWYGIRVETKEYYSQFAEDALLQTYFSNHAWNTGQKLSDSKPGFYVDIGCYSPIRISNTWWFYKQGWRGINVDLSEETINGFNIARPRDINLTLAISNLESERELDFFEFGASSVYNTLDKASSEHTERIYGFKPVIKKIKSMSLSRLLDNYLPEKECISFLSIDAEGHDLEVLKSNNWEKYRPTVVVVEVHEPDFHRLGQTDVVLYMESLGYNIQYWANPSVIFCCT